MRASVLLLGALLVAGCSGGPSPTDPTDDVPDTFGGEVSKARMPKPDFDFSKVIDGTHGGNSALHADPARHAGKFGLERVGYSPLLTAPQSSGPGTDSGFIAMDTWKTWACVAQFGSSGGAVIVDIADPAKPKVAGFAQSGMVNSDCQFTDDGDYLFVAAYTGARSELPVEVPPPVGDFAANGVAVYDVKDKANPKFLFHDSAGANSPGSGSYHNMFTATIGGQIYVFQTYSGNVLTFTPGENKLTIVGKLPHADHDMWIGHHPVTGAWIAITGTDPGGTAVIDLADPTKPVTLGEWAAHDGLTGWHRQWPLANTVEGRALVVVAGEDCGGKSLPYTVLDFTDPANIEELGHWQIPNKPAPNPQDAHLCEFSPHEFETWDGYVATGNYHAGVWLLDIGTLERAMDPVAIGYYLPTENPVDHGGNGNRPWKWNPYVWGAYFDERGYVYAADYYSGLYVLGFGVQHA